MSGEEFLEIFVLEHTDPKYWTMDEVNLEEQKALFEQMRDNINASTDTRSNSQD